MGLLGLYNNQFLVLSCQAVGYKEASRYLLHTYTILF